MSRSRFWNFSLLAVVGTLIGACAADDDEASSCLPTDPGCASATPLVVASVSPSDGAAQVDPSAKVIVTFSKAVQPASVTATSVVVGSAEGTRSVSGTTVTFTPSAPLAAGASYQVRVQGVRDLDGSAMAAPFTSTFTTQSQSTCTDCPATTFTRGDVQGQGRVVETTEGFTVDGSLSIKTSAGKQITFQGATVDVRFDANGRLKSLSGKVQIASPHERVTFGEPVRADVGVFTGRYLNEKRDLGILLNNDTDYFVFDVETTLNMSIATGETGAGATRPVVVRVPIGTRTLMVVDYRDPMYYVYGQHDLIGAAGTGWSLNGRIPFVPKQTVAGLGAFNGRTTRTGTFPVYKVMSVTGQLVDNSATELHLSQQDPFASTLRAGYQAGFNGALSIDLFLKDIAGLEIPVGSASGGVKVEASSTGLSGYAFVKGKTASTNSWWPAFVPVRPAGELDMQARIESNGRFQVRVDGEYGWDLPAARYAMVGSFELSDQAMTLSGGIRGDGAVDLKVTGRVTAASTTVAIEPPALLLDQISKDVNAQVMVQIADAQKAWNDLQKATADYQFELSLRGVRALIPGIVTVAKKGIDDGIKNALKDHEGNFYYTELFKLVSNQAQPYRDYLDDVADAARASDNATTRRVLENALLTLVRNKTLTISVGVFGIGFSYSREILTNAQATQLTQAASYIKFIPATSSVMISMQQIYDLIPTKAIFEQVRDDIKNGVLVMAKIDQLGFVVPHAGQRSFNLFAVIGGKRYETGAIDALTVPALTAKLTSVMVTALRAN